MQKLSIDLVNRKLLAESEERSRPSYTTIPAPSGKAKAVGTPGDPSKRVTKITQIVQPGGGGASAGGKKTKKVSAQPGIPAAGDASKIADETPRPTSKSAGAAKSPAVPSVKKMTPNQTTKLTGVKSPANVKTKGGSMGLPAAKDAREYERTMPTGSQNLGGGKGGRSEAKPKKPESLNGTTRPAKKTVSPKAIGTKSIPQTGIPSKKAKMPSDAPATPKVVSAKKGHNVMESVRIVLNGSVKAKFDVVNRKVVEKMVENYRRHGYNVNVQRGGVPAWRKDRELIALIHESIDAQYNNVPAVAERLRRAAANRFLSVNQTGYNSMYESKRDFVKTINSAFAKIMENADLQYRKKLNIFEGLARIRVGENVVDLEMITQARSPEMALRQFRDEIVESYGFKSRIDHIFVDGDKKLPKDIIEWTERKKVRKIVESVMLSVTDPDTGDSFETTLDDLVANNDEFEADAKKIAALPVGGKTDIGGGAAAHYVIKRIA